MIVWPCVHTLSGTLSAMPPAHSQQGAASYAHGAAQVLKAANQTKFLWIEHWKQLLDTCQMVGSHGVSPVEARLLFVWGQAAVKDELKKRQRAVSHVLFDFVEARTPLRLTWPANVLSLKTVRSAASCVCIGPPAWLMGPCTRGCCCARHQRARRPLNHARVQAICRLADRLSLPSFEELQQYYGGAARMPAAPFADYWLACIVTSKGHAREGATFLKSEALFARELEPDEYGLDRMQACCRVGCDVRRIAGHGVVRVISVLPLASRAVIFPGRLGLATCLLCHHILRALLQVADSSIPRRAIG